MVAASIPLAKSALAAKDDTRPCTMVALFLKRLEPAFAHRHRAYCPRRSVITHSRCRVCGKRSKGCTAVSV